MGADNTDLREAIRTLAGSDELGIYESTICTVSNINTTLMTCDCSPIDGSADFLDVLICVNEKDGFVLIPKNNSLVSITQLNESDAFVSMVSEVDGIWLNGNTNGGLIKIDNLKDQYDTMVNAVKAACVAAFTAQAGIDGGVGLAAFNLSATSILPLNKTPLENTTVKHG